MYAWLEDAIEGGAEVITANKRLSRALRAVYDQAQVNRGRHAWKSPRIVPWSVWINKLLDSATTGGEVPLRLPSQSSALIWERKLKAYAGERVLNPASLVRQAQQSWQRLQDWGVSLDDVRRHAGSEDERLFAVIAAAYQEELEDRGWADQAMLAPLTVRLLRSRQVTLRDPVVYAGFERPAPVVLDLLQALREAGVDVREAPRPARQKGAVRVLCCADPEAELRAAGAWARRVLDRNGAASVAIVCRGLEQDAPRAARLVREGLAPGWQRGGHGHRTAVNVSYGRRLAEYPLVANALLWLHWAGRGLPSRDVSVLLRSPLAGRGFRQGRPADGRSRLDRALRSLPDRVWRPAALAAALADADTGADAADWLQRVERVAAFEAERTTTATPAGWAGRIDSLLGEVGWPGEMALDSAEFQLVNRWRELLNDLSRLDLVRPEMTGAEAIARLSSFATETVYQPEQGAGAVQLIGTLEAAGIEFEHLWVSGLDAQNWPPPAHPLPLVSRELQRQFGMPDATPMDTLRFSRLVLKRLAGSSPQVVFSWARAHTDLDIEPSPLLESYLATGAEHGEDPGWYATRLVAGDRSTDEVPDRVPPARPDELLSGGATTVQRQVDDPFSAFACGRLGVSELPAFETGISPRTRGDMVHRALHQLLHDKPSSAAIGAWSAAEVESRIARALDVALAPALRTADAVLQRLLAIERRRLRTVLASFLQEESSRQPFEIVATEESIIYARHGIRLCLRIDRVDRTAGELLVIDYKSGAPKSLLTQQGEPKQLQLVVYACALEEPVGALLLINVDRRAIVYKGAGGDWERGKQESWGLRLARWKTLVDDAIAAMAAGDVRLNLVRQRDDGRFLNVLSRIEELRRER